MEDAYDCVILGTGLKECILSGLLSVDGKKVLHLDRNDYYGSESASLNLRQLFERFRGAPDTPAALGSARDYNVDLIPKFIMADGLLVKMLVKTQVTRYLEFKMVDGSYVARGGKVHKVPATDGEALRSSLMGFFEKRRCKNFLEYAGEFRKDDPKTFKDKNPLSQSCKELFDAFGLEADTQSFLGHALALHTDDKYLSRPAAETFERIRLYVDSLTRFMSQTKESVSPFIYPLYGLGELPQAFARLSAIYGGTYMLRKPVEELVFEDGVVCGVKSEGEVARCKFVVGEPSYFPDQVKKTGQIIRCICVLSHPIKGVDKPGSVQIIIPQHELNRNSDIYVTVVGNAHNVAPANKWLAIVATTVETSNPQSEVEAALKLLQPVDEMFVSVVDTYEPRHDGRQNQCFISTSFDATSHFETTCRDVMDMYQRITGKPLDLTPPPAASSSDD